MTSFSESLTISLKEMSKEIFLVLKIGVFDNRKYEIMK